MRKLCVTLVPTLLTVEQKELLLSIFEDCRMNSEWRAWLDEFDHYRRWNLGTLIWSWHPSTEHTVGWREGRATHKSPEVESRKCWSVFSLLGVLCIENFFHEVRPLQRYCTLNCLSDCAIVSLVWGRNQQKIVGSFTMWSHIAKSSAVFDR